MTNQDSWGQDPSVRWMRRMFKEMERRQQKLLRRFDISMVDRRLRSWRERALALFEDAWSKASLQGILPNEEKAGEMYVAGLLTILQAEGVVVPESSPVAGAALDASTREEKG